MYKWSFLKLLMASAYVSTKPSYTMFPDILLVVLLHQAQLLYFTSIDVHSATHAITVYDGHYSAKYCGPQLKRAWIAPFLIIPRTLGLTCCRENTTVYIASIVSLKLGVNT